MAQKFLILGYVQPLTMGLFMLIIILYFAKDEKRRTESKDTAESSAIGSVAVGEDALYADIQQINQTIETEEQGELERID